MLPSPPPPMCLDVYINLVYLDDDDYDDDVMMMMTIRHYMLPIWI